MIIKNRIYSSPGLGITFRLYLSLAAFLASGLLWMASCQQSQHRQTLRENGQSKITSGRTEIKYAKGFDIEYFDTYKLIKVFNHSANSVDTIKYALVPTGNAAPKGFTKSRVIEIPVKELVGMSSLQIAMADFVDSPDILKGLASLKYVTSPKVRQNIKSGKVIEVGEEGTINKEAIIAMKPGLVMAMGNPSASFKRYQTLVDAGVPVLLVSEWLENTPLGRAEWVKLMAALVNKEELVNKKFGLIEKEYIRLAQLGRNAVMKPHIIVGMPYKGSWFVPDGTSFMTRFFKDAGASYNWYDVKGTGSMGMTFESVAPIALKADYWINSGTAHSKADIAALDVRYTYFKPYKNNTIYNFNKKVNDLGSNDYWESGVVNPHIVLSDLIKILHPGILPHHELVYYKQIK
ncbi:ABC transporter substrate-binding protein [Paradesertivirga mongoliensis]|uniref:ABC transporter substrate-binding protein n=1 Tax=Paradesertivirga mongoliensis TaxID=2100740 RepID=A0ABW4ZQ96_9SPHI|nr:ABC transporter substrate-binding protein [Pedobacter mongoliensis]